FPRPEIAPTLRKLPAPSLAAAPDPTRAPAPLAPPTALPSRPPARRPVLAPLAPERYELRFTIQARTREKLRKAQDLLRHSVPSGDPAEIFDRALTALLEDVARRKFAAIRTQPAAASRRTAAGSRHVPAEVRRSVWLRDGARCAFIAQSGRRCAERGFLEFHHVRPYGVGGPPTVDNIELRCRAHNVYEAKLFYGEASAIRSGTT